jgi:hypothetical protein
MKSKKMRFIRTLTVLMLSFVLVFAMTSLAFADNNGGLNNGHPGNSADNVTNSPVDHGSTDNGSGNTDTNNGASGQKGGGEKQGQVPETPYAALMPLSLLLAAVVIYRKRLKTQ